MLKNVSIYLKKYLLVPNQKFFGEINKKVTDEIVFIKKENKEIGSNINNQITKINEEDNFLADSSHIYFDLLEEHYKMKIPFLGIFSSFGLIGQLKS